MADRALVFIDGNNWYHALCDAGVEHRARLDYKKISEKLLGPRTWVGTRYYIGQVSQKHNAQLYGQQRSFLASLQNTDPRITIHLGRIEARNASNEAVKELREYLGKMTARMEPTIFADLSEIAKRHEQATVFVEKAVDVFLAVDLVTMAMSDAYDAAYLLTARRRLHTRRRGRAKARQKGIRSVLLERRSARQNGQCIHSPAANVVR